MKGQRGMTQTLPNEKSNFPTSKISLTAGGICCLLLNAVIFREDAFLTAVMRNIRENIFASFVHAGSFCFYLLIPLIKGLALAMHKHHSAYYVARN